MNDRAKVFLVGAGPGDPELLTCKALKVIQRADVIIYDRLISPEILSLVNPDSQLIYAGKEYGQQDDVQDEIFGWFLRLAHTARRIVRLKCGDPMVFGRGGEELDFLIRHGFEVELVPGVSSVVAGPGLAGIPLTLRGVAASFAVVLGHRESLEEVDWATFRKIDTLVVLMGVHNRVAIACGLIAKGRSAQEPVAFIENASLEQERVVETTLGDVALGRVDVSPPAVFIIGEVVRVRSQTKRLRLAEAIS